MNFYVLNADADAIKKFFSVLPEDQRPRVVSDKDNPAVWDHPSDEPQVIATDEPRLDADAKELTLDGRQVDEVMAELKPEEEIASDEPAFTPPEQPEETPKVAGYRTYRDRGFKVGRLS